MKKKTKIAVVILNWNGSRMLRDFLPSVLRHSAGEGVEVIVADNASADDSLSMMEHEFPQVRLIRLQQNYGFADGYNIALAQVEAEYYVLLNSDVQVSPHWLEPMEQYLDTHPGTAVCQPKIKSQKNPRFFEHAGACGGFIDRYGYPFCRGRILEETEADEGQYDTIVPIFWASGAAMFIRACDYREAGGLDGRFFAHMEEIDLCWRLRSRAREIVCIPGSTVFHVGAATLKKDSPQKIFLNFRNNLLMLYKNLPNRELRKVMLVRLLLDRVAALAFLLKGNPAGAKAVFQARSEFRRIKKDFSSCREDNLKKGILRSIPERIKGSILVAYYLKRIRKYSQFR